MYMYILVVFLPQCHSCLLIGIESEREEKSCVMEEKRGWRKVWEENNTESIPETIHFSVHQNLLSHL